MTDEDKILEFRKAFINLPENYKEREVTRVYNIVKNIPIIVLEDHDIGKVLKFLDVQNLIEYFYREKNLKVSASFIYKVLKGKFQLVHGYKIYYEYER